MVKEYEIPVDVINNSITTTINTPSTTWWDDSYARQWTSGTYSYTYATTIYMYQLICPRCKTTNWGQVDTVVECKGMLPSRIRGRKVVEEKCGAKLKAVSQPVDFEIPVG